MKRIKITAICMSLLAILAVTGCVCPPAYLPSMNRGVVSSHIPFDSGCDPCGPIGSCDMVDHCDPCGSVTYGGFVGFGGHSCAPQYKIVDCRTSFSNIGNGTLLIGRGVLDIAAAPFVLIGNMLSSGCRYELIKICDTGFFGQPLYQTVDPCCSVSTSGCDTCAGGFSEGIQYNVNSHQPQTRVLPATALPTPARRSSSVIQASHIEPTAPAVRFVQPVRR